MEEGGVLLADEQRLNNIIQNVLRPLPEDSPAAYRKDLQLGVDHNIAGIQFLIDKAQAGKGPMDKSAKSIQMYDAVIERCDELLGSSSENNRIFRRAIKLLAHMNQIEAPVSYTHLTLPTILLV